MMISVDTPEGPHVVESSPCFYCGEPILDGERIVLGDALSHTECTLRCVIGSVGHLRRECSCYGGDADDPAGMTKREAAQAAVDIWRAREGHAPLDWSKRNPWRE